MNGVPNQASIERERAAIVLGVRGINTAVEYLKARRKFRFVSIWLAYGLLGGVPTLLAWLVPGISLAGRIGISLAAMTVALIVPTSFVGAFEKIELPSLNNQQVAKIDIWEAGRSLATSYVATFNVPPQLKGKAWTAKSRLVYAMEHDGIFYTLDFGLDETCTPMFSVRKGVLPDDQREQRELDVLFMHLANQKAQLYGLGQQLSLQGISDQVGAP